MESKVNILVVEDEGIVALGLEDTLQSEGYHVSGIADNGKQALSIVEKEPVDLVLLDIHIKGDWDGIETARRLMTFRDIPIIYLTAFSDDRTLERAKETTPAAYLTKPYQPRNLLIAIELALHNFALRKTHAAPVIPLPGKEHSPDIIQKEPILCFNDAIFIKQNYKFIKVNLKDIYYLEAKNNHTYIATKDKNFFVRHTLNLVMDKFDRPYFIRVHRSYAINMDHLDTFNNNSVFLKDHEIPLGRNYKDDFLQRFNFL
jgi:DNA-binding LytR/AlgR family response regulator